MYRYIFIIVTLFVAINGLEKREERLDLGQFKGEVHVGEKLTAPSLIRKDIYASLDLENLINGLVMQIAGLDPIIKDELAPFPLEYDMMTGHVNLTKFRATGMKYMKFKNVSLYRSLFHDDDSLRIDLSISTPILATKFRFASSVNILWREYNVPGFAYIYLEHVRLQVSTLVRPRQRANGSGSKRYQITGLSMGIDVDNIRVILFSYELPLKPKEILENSKNKLLETVAQGAIEEVNVALDQVITLLPTHKS